MTETIKDIETEAIAIPEQARALQVTSNETYQTAGNMLIQIKGLRKKIGEVFRPMKAAAVKAHKAVLEQERIADAPLVKAENIIKPALAKWDYDQEQIRRQAEIKAQAAAKEAEDKRKLDEAVALEQAGDKEAADEVMDEPVYVPPVIVAKTVPKVAGMHFTKRWVFEVTDVSKVPRQYLSINEKAIRKVVEGLKGATQIPGVRAYQTTGVSGRGQHV